MRETYADGPQTPSVAAGAAATTTWRQSYVPHSSRGLLCEARERSWRQSIWARLSSLYLAPSTKWQSGAISSHGVWRYGIIALKMAARRHGEDSSAPWLMSQKGATMWKFTQECKVNWINVKTDTRLHLTLSDPRGGVPWDGVIWWWRPFGMAGRYHSETWKLTGCNMINPSSSSSTTASLSSLNCWSWQELHLQLTLFC